MESGEIYEAREEFEDISMKYKELSDFETTDE